MHEYDYGYTYERRRLHRSASSGPCDSSAALRELVLSLVPDASETMAYNMPAVKVKGKTVLYYAGAAHHLGLYPMPKVIELLHDELAAYSTSKGTIRIPYSEPLPVDLIKKIVAIRLSEVSR